MPLLFEFKQMGVSDSYLYQSVRANLEENYADKVEVWFESPAVELVQEAETKAILGLKVDNAGVEKNNRAKGGVVLCCGGFENDRDMTAAYLNLVGYAYIGALGNTGDGVLMAQKADARGRVNRRRINDRDRRSMRPKQLNASDAKSWHAVVLVRFPSVALVSFGLPAAHPRPLRRHPRPPHSRPPAVGVPTFPFGYLVLPQLFCWNRGEGEIVVVSW